jgi:hypothetical protein
MTAFLVSPDGAERWGDGKAQATLRIDEAAAKARPGDEIVFLPGVYSQPFVLADKKGNFAMPLRLRGLDGVTWDGRRNLVRPLSPGSGGFRDQFAFLKIFDSSGIVVEDVAIQNVWPTGILISNSQQIVLRRLNMAGGTYAIQADGAHTRRIAIEHCAWTGNPDIWDKVLWRDIHEMPWPRRELDGDFFRSFDIAGDVVIRNNMIQHVFNGVHLFATTHAARARAVNRNVWIYRNSFAFVRDNAVEAERHAGNWWVWGNRFFNTHKAFAFEAATGGDWYLFANLLWFNAKPGPPGDGNAGGAVWKVHAKTFNDAPIWFFHNTLYLRSAYIKKGRLTKFSHVNNAIAFGAAADHEIIVEPNREMFGGDFLATHVPGDTMFRGDVCSHGQLAAEAVRLGVEASVRAPLDPGYHSPIEEYEFWPARNSPLQGAGQPLSIPLAGAAQWEVPGKLNVGAYKGVEYDATYTPADLRCPPGRAEPDWAEPGYSAAFPLPRMA